MVVMIKKKKTRKRQIQHTGQWSLKNNIEEANELLDSEKVKINDTEQKNISQKTKNRAKILQKQKKELYYITEVSK